MYPFRHRLTIPILVRKDGSKSIAEFPVDVEEGDQLLLSLESKGWQAPRNLTISGFSEGGPIFSDRED